MYKAQAEKHRAVLRTVSNTQITSGSNPTGDFRLGNVMATFNYKEGFIRTASVCCVLYFMVAIPLWVNLTANTYQEAQALKPSPTSQSDFFQHVGSVCRSYSPISCHKVCSSVTDLEQRSINRLMSTSMSFAGRTQETDKHKYITEDTQYYEQREEAWKNCLNQRYETKNREMYFTAVTSFAWVVSAPLWLLLTVLLAIKLRHPIKTTLFMIYNTFAIPVRWIMDGFKDTKRR